MAVALKNLYDLSCRASPGILCGEYPLLQKPCPAGCSEAVSAERNLSKSSSLSRRSTAKTSHNDNGNALSQSEGMNRARAALQNALCAKFSSHHVRHLSRVRRSIETLARKSRTRSGVNPWRIAVTSTTTNPR